MKNSREFAIQKKNESKKLCLLIVQFIGEIRENIAKKSRICAGKNSRRESRIRMNSHEFAWILANSKREFSWILVHSREFVWIRMNSREKSFQYRRCISLKWCFEEKKLILKIMLEKNIYFQFIFNFRQSYLIIVILVIIR